ncbi:FHA domain-containing protein, partial [Kitasatospora sp. MBT63]
MAERQFALTAPQLVLDADGDTRVMNPGRTYHVGRDPASEIVLSDPRVSWHHAVLHVGDGHWMLDDVGSTNGTYTGGHRVAHLDVGPGSELRFGSPADGPRCTLQALPPPAP